MLIMVIKKPIQLTKVSDEPFTSAGAFWATIVENIGESAITTILQKVRNIKSAITELLFNIKGEMIQLKQESSNAAAAVLPAPKLCDRYPLATQDRAPAAIIRNDNKGTFKAIKG